MPRVSVVIPAYNGALFIGEALESLLNQSCPADQIIVVNDGSTDETAEILRGYADKIQIIDQPNAGVAAARNRGLAAAEGDLVAFLDQDDLLLPDKLRRQVDCLAQHPGAGMLHSGWRLVNAAGRKLSDVEPWHDLPVLDSAGWIRRMPVLFSAMLFRRDWLLRVGGLSERFRQVCDVELIQRLVLAGCESVWLPQITVLYRQHEANDSRNTLVQAAECWAVQDELFARADLPLDLRQLESESRYYNAVWIAWRLYHTQRLEEMARYLELAFRYRPGTWTEAMLQWIELFKTYEASYGQSLDLAALLGSAEWQRLTGRLLKLQTAAS